MSPLAKRQMPAFLDLSEGTHQIPPKLNRAEHRTRSHKSVGNVLHADVDRRMLIMCNCLDGADIDVQAILGTSQQGKVANESHGKAIQARILRLLFVALGLGEEHVAWYQG